MEEESLDQSMPWRLACFWVLGEIDEPGVGPEDPSGRRASSRHTAARAT